MLRARGRLIRRRAVFRVPTKSRRRALRGKFGIRAKSGHESIPAGFKPPVREGSPCWTRERSHYLVETTRFARHRWRTVFRTPMPGVGGDVLSSKAPADPRRYR